MRLSVIGIVWQSSTRWDTYTNGKCYGIIAVSFFFTKNTKNRYHGTDEVSILNLILMFTKNTYIIKQRVTKVQNRPHESLFHALIYNGSMTYVKVCVELMTMGSTSCFCWLLSDRFWSCGKKNDTTEIHIFSCIGSLWLFMSMDYCFCNKSCLQPCFSLAPKIIFEKRIDLFPWTFFYNIFDWREIAGLYARFLTTLLAVH